MAAATWAPRPEPPPPLPVSPWGTPAATTGLSPGCRTVGAGDVLTTGAVDVVVPPVIDGAEPRVVTGVFRAGATALPGGNGEPPPLLPAAILRHDSSVVFPQGQISPIPVITTLRATQLPLCCSMSATAPSTDVLPPQVHA